MITISIDYNQYLLFDFQVNPHLVTANNYKTTAVFTVYIWNAGHAASKKKTQIMFIKQWLWVVK